MKRGLLLFAACVLLSASFGCWQLRWEKPWYPAGVRDEKPKMIGYWIHYEAWEPIFYYAFLEDGTVTLCTDCDFRLTGTYTLSDSQAVLVWNYAAPHLDSLSEGSIIGTADTLSNVFTLRNFRPKPWGRSGPEKYSWLCYETARAKTCLTRIPREQFPCDCSSDSLVGP